MHVTGLCCSQPPTTMTTMNAAVATQSRPVSERVKVLQERLELERGERQEREQSSEKRISTIHRESEISLEPPDGRATSPPAMSPTRQSCHSHPEKTDMAVRYAPPRTNGAARDRERGQRQALSEHSNEFDRRLLNAKRLKKVPMPSVESIPWFHPSVSRHIAESLLLHKDINDGTYLLRDSVSQSDSLTLSVRCHNAVRHYRVQWDGRQFCFGLGKFTDVKALLEHFEQQPLISGDSGMLVKLSYPYPRGVVEPSDYQEAVEVDAAILTAGDMLPSLSVNSKEGFLTKLGYHRKNWKLRWFVLRKNQLKYYSSREDTTPLRVINLDEARGVARDDSTGRPFCFRLVMPYRTFFMLASSDLEANDWVAMLRWRLENSST